MILNLIFKKQLLIEELECMKNKCIEFKQNIGKTIKVNHYGVHCLINDKSQISLEKAWKSLLFKRVQEHTFMTIFIKLF